MLEEEEEEEEEGGGFQQYLLLYFCYGNILPCTMLCEKGCSTIYNFNVMMGTVLRRTLQIVSNPFLENQRTRIIVHTDIYVLRSHVPMLQCII